MGLRAFFALTAIFADESAATLAGHWVNGSGSVVIFIAPCAEKWCGSVQWASEKAQTDAARGGTTTLVGTEILHGFIEVEPGRWKGQLFVPDLDKRSKAELRQLGADRLQVRGCAVGRLICKSQIWTRTEPR
jgi:uncharacterized protein (DUF2147 family)